MIDKDILDFLEREMNKFDLFYFELSKEDCNHIYGIFKHSNKRFCTFYIDVLEKVVRGDESEHSKNS